MKDPQKSDGDGMQNNLDRLRRWSALAPTDPDARLALARKLLECKIVDEAILEIRAVITMLPNHLEARKLLESAHELRVSERRRT